MNMNKNRVSVETLEKSKVFPWKRREFLGSELIQDAFSASSFENNSFPLEWEEFF